MEQNKFLDIQGLKHLWSKISLQDYPNNTVLMAVIEAINEELEAIKATPSAQIIVWEEND